MEENLMELGSSLNLLKGLLVALEAVHVNLLEEAPHLALVAASTVVLMATGLETAKLGIGKTSAIAVEGEVTLKKTARTVQRISGVNGVIHDHRPPAITVKGAGVTAVVVVTVDQDPLLRKESAV